MLVELASLKPNPMRDFIVDPIDGFHVDELQKSIEEDGFWGGILCRQADDGTIQIGAGHHRVAAAIRAGIKTADVCVRNGDMDDAAMIRVYARENATQRTNSGTSQAGSVAAAIRFIAKLLMTGATPEFMSSLNLEVLRHRLTDSRGLGQEVVVLFLDGVPGINENTVIQALANLKASGDYARIIGEVQEEIEEENKEALKALEKAEREQKRLEKERAQAEERQKQAEAARKEAAAKAKAAKEEADKKRAEEAVQRAELERKRAEEQNKLAEKRRAEAQEEMKKFDALKKTRDTAAKAVEAADKRPITFDFEGVARHLKNPHQIDAFRQCVTGQGIAPYLAVNKQAALAKHLVKLAKERGDKEISAAFIRENVTALVLNVRSGQRQIDEEEKRAVLMNDVRMRLHQHQRDFSRCCRGLAAYATKIKEVLEREWPPGEAVPISKELRDTLASAKTAIDDLIMRI